MPSPVSARTRQSRSLESASRLLDAAELSLRENDFEATSLSEIARRAGLTTGAIYSSFANKTALLAAIETTVCAEIESDAKQAFADAPRGTTKFAGAVVRAIIASYSARRGGLRALALAARQNAPLAARVSAVNRRILDLFLDAVQERAEGRTKDWAEAEIGFLIVTSALRETIVFETAWPTRETFTLDRLATALTIVLANHIAPGANR